MTFIKQFTKKILQYEAKLTLKRYKPKIIAITGSVGKSTTRDAIYSTLSRSFHVRKSEKSFTAELGVPLAIIGCKDGVGGLIIWIKNIFLGFLHLLYTKHYPTYLILEIDGDKPGDLKIVSSIIKPDVLVITAIGDVPAHIESFSDMENFLIEKRALVDRVKRDGVIVYNADDRIAQNLVEYTEIQKISCGIGAQDTKIFDFSGSPFQIEYASGKAGGAPTGMRFEITSNKTHEIIVHESIGPLHEYAALLSFAVGSYLEISVQKIVGALNKITPLPGRMNILAGIKDTVIVDDSYNSSPLALKAAMDVLKGIKSKGRKIAVVGDMLELGRFSADEHRKAAFEINETADIAVCVGIRARKISDELLNLGMKESNILFFDNSEEAGKIIQEMLKIFDIVLVKGSQDMRMEKIVEEIMQNPEEKEGLLVRQEEYWKEK